MERPSLEYRLFDSAKAEADFPAEKPVQTQGFSWEAELLPRTFPPVLKACFGTPAVFQFEA